VLLHISPDDGDAPDGPLDDPWSRRTFLAGALGLAAAAGLGACGSKAASGEARPTATRVAAERRLPAPADAPFDTVVVLMMENRSFDHLLGWLPGADGKQAGLTFRDTAGHAQRTYPIAPDFQGWGLADPKHDWRSMVTHYDHGKADGFLKTAPVGDHWPISYYRATDLPILASLARSYTTFDRYFCSFLGATWPNRFYQHCATTDVDLTGLFPGTVLPRPSNLKLAIWDRLKAAHLSGRYYYHSEPMTGLFASKRYDSIAHPYGQFLKDAKAGTLPNVAFVDPDYGTIAELMGTSNDMHPHGSVAVGDAFIGQVYDALRTSPQWDRMVFVLNFDENGGFYDHVVPPRVRDSTVGRGPGPHPDYHRLGFRVPCIAMGPYAPAQVWKRGPYEHCSILKMIEWRWGLAPMTDRDRYARNLAEALDFSRAPAPPVTIPHVTPPATIPRPINAPL